MSVSIGQFVRQCVLENSELKNQEILDKVLEKFPEAKTTISCIAWYKTDMRKKGLIGGRSAITKDGIIKEIELLEKRLETLKLQLKAMEEEAAAAVGEEQTEAAPETETKTVAEKPSKSRNKSKQEQEPAIEVEPALM